MKQNEKWSYEKKDDEILNTIDEAKQNRDAM